MCPTDPRILESFNQTNTDINDSLIKVKINLSGLGAPKANHHAVERQPTGPLRALHAKRGKPKTESELIGKVKRILCDFKSARPIIQ